VADVPSQADETPLPWSDLWKQYLGDRTFELAQDVEYFEVALTSLSDDSSLPFTLRPRSNELGLDGEEGVNAGNQTDSNDSDAETTKTCTKPVIL
jgi:hypothetical protein